MQLELSVSEFLALLNQTLEYAYPQVVVVGELSSFRVSKNRWVYFDIKDETAAMRCFGTVYALPGPLEDGMLVKVIGQPRVHPQYGFSLNVQQIQPSGEGAIKKAASLLEAKLTMEGLFALERKRPVPYPPAKIGLITSKESAAYGDFIKVLAARWGGLDIRLVDVQVQGEAAAAQITEAVELLNQQAQPADLIVIIRGGGSAENLQAFNDEQVTRAVAASRLPTLVAIGHERDTSLAELAADVRASTPSHAAEILVPDKRHIIANLQESKKIMSANLDRQFEAAQSQIQEKAEALNLALSQIFEQAAGKIAQSRQVLDLLNPTQTLKRGYAIVRKGGKAVYSANGLQNDDIVNIDFSEGQAIAAIKSIKGNSRVSYGKGK